VQSTIQVAEVHGRAAEMARERDWTSLWRLVLSLPAPHAVLAAGHLKRRRWRPGAPADRDLADLLAGASRREVLQVADTVPAAVARPLPGVAAQLSPAGFGHGCPTAVVNAPAHGSHVTRLVVVDRTGATSTAYHGPAVHDSLCCPETGIVVAVREPDAHHPAEIVRYTADAAEVLVRGTALAEARVESTARGFAVGAAYAPLAFAMVDGELQEAHLDAYGVHRGELFAVDPTGTRIAFVAGRRLLVTDAALQPLHALDLPHESGDQFTGVCYPGDAIITSTTTGALHVHRFVDGRLQQARPARHAPARPAAELVPVPAWNLLVGATGGPNRCLDALTLDPRDLPHFVDGAGTGRFSAAAYSPLAVYDGTMTIDPRRGRESVGVGATIVHDLRHPLNALALPIGSLGPADAGMLSAALADGEYELSPSAQRVLELVRAAAELAPALDPF
jgi:hypothetical protein